MTACPSFKNIVGVPGSKLPDQFFIDLALLGHRRKSHPDVFLTPWCYESQLDPGAVNPHGGARGLNQMMPATLHGLGAPADYERLSGEEQLPWIEKLIVEGETLNGGPFKTAGRYYHSNAYPATMSRGSSPGTVVYGRDAASEDERTAYAWNMSLDFNHDGRVTLGDLEELMLCVRREPKFQPAFARLARAIETLWPSVPTARLGADDLIARRDGGRSRLLVGGLFMGAIGFAATRGLR